MLKKSRLILVVLSAMLCFAGCTKKAYSVRICGFSDSVSEFDLKTECTTWEKGYYQDKTQPKTVSVPYNGGVLKGTYYESELAFGTNEIRHTYEDAEHHFFDVDQNGKLISCFFGKPRNPGEAKTEKECVEIADAVLAGLSDVDISKYQKTVTFSEMNGCYTVEWRKYIRDIAAEDVATVMIAEDGSVYSFRLDMFGKVDESKIPELDLDAIDAEVKKRLDDMSVKAKEKYDSVKYQTKYVLSVAPKTKPILLCYADVECIQKAEGINMVSGEKIIFEIALK